MYNYNPTINALRKQSIEKAKRLKEKLSENSNDESQQKKKNVNLLIVVEPDGKAQFDDTHNTIWEVREIPSFANYESFVDLCKRFDFKNIAVVHHGDTFSDHTYPKSMKVVLSANFLSILTKSFNQLPKKDLITLDDEYFESLRKETEKHFQDGLLLKEIKAYISFRLLFDNMLDNSNFFSVACDEADDKEFLTEMGKLTDKKVKIFANSNYTMISAKRHFPTNNPYILNFGSILNSFVTDENSWLNVNGWSYFDSSTKKTTITKKDLWLYSTNKTKVYDLFDRNKILTKEQNIKIGDYQIFHSKKFKIEYVKYNDKKQYDLLIFQILKRNPELTITK